MKQPPRRSWLPLALIILGLLLLVMYEMGYLAPLESVLGYILDPLQRVFDGVSDGFGNMFQSVRETRELQAEAEALQSRVDELTVENVRLQEYRAEVEQLRALLNFVSEYPISGYVGADVVGRDACDVFPCGDVVGVDPNPYLRYVTINVGSRQGVEVGDPVVSSGAKLVGRIAQVGPRSSRVQLLTDVDSSTAVILQGSRVTGLVVGQPDGTLMMEWIPQDEVIAEEEIVLTSGFGWEIPKGLIVGQIAEVEKVDYELHQRALVRPAVDFRRLELVLVVTGFDPTPLEEEVTPTPTPEPSQ